MGQISVLKVNIHSTIITSTTTTWSYDVVRRCSTCTYIHYGYLYNQSNELSLKTVKSCYLQRYINLQQNLIRLVDHNGRPRFRAIYFMRRHQWFVSRPRNLYSVLTIVKQGASLTFKSISFKALHLFKFDCETTLNSVPGTNLY